MQSDDAGGCALWSDFNALCDFGGRLAGSASERQAVNYLKRRGAAATGRQVRIVPVSYQGWSAAACSLHLLRGRAHPVPCRPLVRTVPTPPEGLTAEVLDLGRGTPEEFEAHAAEIAGRIALVRHEYMFAAGHIHRRRKYQMARERGAVGFLIASPFSGGGLVAGSSGRLSGDGIPALSIGRETAASLGVRSGRRPRVRISVAAAETPAQTETLVFDIPAGAPECETRECVVLSAHLDGHDLAESAMDNATGVAAALATAAALVPLAGAFRRDLRLCFFSAEEWALTGSRDYVDGLGEAERQRIVLNVNLDSVGGSPRLTALTSDFAGLEGFLRQVAADCGHELGIHRPTMANSDHANFARVGIPALRLVAGFDEPASNLRHVLTPADTRDKVASSELFSAVAAATAIVSAACAAPGSVTASFRGKGDPG